MAAVGFLSKELNDQDIASSVGSFQPDGVRCPSGNNNLGNAKNSNRSCDWGVLGPSSRLSHHVTHLRRLLALRNSFPCPSREERWWIIARKHLISSSAGDLAE